MEQRQLTKEELAKLTYTLTNQQLQEIMNYLSGRPAGEVLGLVNMLLSIPFNKEQTDVTPSKPTLVEVQKADQA